MLSNYLILCYPLILSSFFLSIKVFSNESAIHTEWPKYWSFSFRNILSNEHSGLISFKIDMFDLFVVQGILEVFSQHHILNESILQRSVPSWPNSHLYVTTGNTIALTIWTDFEGRLMSLLFNMLSWFAIAFLPRGKTLLISWLQSPSTVLLKPVKMKLVTASTFPSSSCQGVMGPIAIILVFTGASPIAQLVKNLPANAGDPSSIPGLERSAQEGRKLLIPILEPGKLHRLYIHGFAKRQTGLNEFHFQFWASLVAQLVKKPPAIWETWVWSLGWEDPLEKVKAIHSSILAWRIPRAVSSMGTQRVGEDWVIFTFTFLSFYNVEFQASFFTLLFHFHQEALQFLFTFCH